MTISAATILHRLSGAPRLDAACEREDQCWHCGAHMTRGMTVDEWGSASFTGQNRIRGGAHLTHICEPCVWVMSRVPGVVPGAPEMHNWRLYTVLVDGADVWRGNKANKPAILAWLRKPKAGEWFAAIADSGQKHVVPYAPVNPPGTRRGRIQFEEDCITLGDWKIVDDMIALLTAGATKDSIGSGAYSGGEWQRCGREAIDAFELMHGRHRGGPWFRLALWLSQRDEEAVAVRMAAEKVVRDGKGKRRDEGGVAKPAGAGAARPPSGVPRSRGKPAEALGSVARPDARGGADLGEPRGVAYVDVPVAPARSPEQRGLFDALGVGGDGGAVPKRSARSRRA
jgi:hypothetical protein